jgi:hypothetical protein
MFGNLICGLQKGKEMWSAFWSDREEAKKCMPLFNLQKKKKRETLSYIKHCCLLFLQTAFIILSTQVTIYIAAHLCRQLQNVAYSNDLQQVHTPDPKRGGSGSIPRQSVWDSWCVRLASCKPFPRCLYSRLQIMIKTAFVVLQREIMYLSSRC